MSSDKEKFKFVDSVLDDNDLTKEDNSYVEISKVDNVTLSDLDNNIESNIKESNNNTSLKTKHYVGYNFRLILSVIILIVLLATTVLFTINIFHISKENAYNYSETSAVDYKVYLKDNNFYEEEYLNKDMLYVASLIDKINVNFNYKFNAEENSNIDFKYNIYAKLVITDYNDQNVYYEKEYNLIPEKSVLLSNGKSKIINETLDISYEYYNRIANNFKNSYALSTKSKLIVYFNIDKNSSSNKNIIINKNDNNMYLEIPLSEKSVNIELNSNSINNSNKIILNKNGGVKINYIYVILSIISLILFIIVIVRVLKLISFLRRDKNVYDTYIEKILNEYDRMIVKTATPPIKKENVMKVESFEELLDVRDNIKQPIMYYEVTKHIKCQFYITNEDKIYLTTIKKVDLEDKNEKK